MIARLASALTTSLARLPRDRRGTTAVEFALIGLPFVILLLGLVEFGRGLHIRTALDNAADHAQRAILIDPATPAATLTALARAHFDAGDSTALAVSLRSEQADGRDYRVVALSYEMQLLLPAPLGRAVTLAMERQVLVP